MNLTGPPRINSLTLPYASLTAPVRSQWTNEARPVETAQGRISKKRTSKWRGTFTLGFEAADRQLVLQLAEQLDSSVVTFYPRTRAATDTTISAPISLPVRCIERPDLHRLDVAQRHRVRLAFETTQTYPQIPTGFGPLAQKLVSWWTPTVDDPGFDATGVADLTNVGASVASGLGGRAGWSSDGSGQRLQLTGSGLPVPLGSVGPSAMCWWWKAESGDLPSSISTLFSNGAGSNGDEGIWLYTRTNGGVAFNVSDDTERVVELVPGLAWNEWNFIALSIGSDSTLTCRLNEATVQVQTSLSLPQIAGSTSHVFSYKGTSAHRGVGHLISSGIYSQPLTSAQLDFLYNDGDGRSLDEAVSYAG